jgi:hypothetical protein
MTIPVDSASPVPTSGALWSVMDLNLSGCVKTYHSGYRKEAQQAIQHGDWRRALSIFMSRVDPAADLCADSSSL